MLHNSRSIFAGWNLALGWMLDLDNKEYSQVEFNAISTLCTKERWTSARLEIRDTASGKIEVRLLRVLDLNC